MAKLNFSISINAPREKVWKVLWDDASYRDWTSVFMEGSYAVTDNWKEGSKVLFLAPGGDGMVSSVAANKKNEFMSFEHLGEVKNGVEDTKSEKVKVWAGAHENYTLKDENGKTKLEVDLESNDEGLKDYFSRTFPVALEKVKDLSEKN